MPQGCPRKHRPTRTEPKERKRKNHSLKEKTLPRTDNIRKEKRKEKNRSLKEKTGAEGKKEKKRKNTSVI